MKILIIVLSFVWLSNAQADGPKSTGWALLYGLAENKSERTFTPEGNAYKGIFTFRWPRFDIGLNIRYASLKDDITYANLNGDITHKNLTAGVQFGVWIFSWLQVHGGYARHDITEEIEGGWGYTQKNTMTTTYGIVDKKTGGLYGGGELVILQSKSIQLFANYDYYRLNQMQAHEWEAMAGLRLYIDQKSSSGTSGNFFTNFFEKLFLPK